MVLIAQSVEELSSNCLLARINFMFSHPCMISLLFFVRSCQIHVRTLRHSKYNCSLASFLIFSSASAEREIVPIVANASSFHFFSVHIWMRISMWKKNINITSISTWIVSKRRKVSITVERLRATDRGSIAEAASINFCTQRELDFNEPFKRRQKVGLFPQHIIQSFMHFIFSAGRVIKVSWSGLGSILG